ncbi:MAG: DUF2752 domain-containing protein [Actinobacteria bacterium]|nr:DUF2752 domain-containing protein [Actinomycetota bacterium]
MSHAHATRAPIAVADRLGHGLVLLGAVGTCTLLYAVDPAAEGNPYPACPFRALTGMPCPGCGTLRATNRLLHGDVGAAFGYNALFILMVPIFVYILATSMAAVVGSERPRISLPRWTGYAVLVTVLAFWVLRNIPVEPFTALAP